MLDPLKRVRLLILYIRGDEGIDVLAHLAGTGKARTGQGLRGQDAEPDLGLIEPGGMGGDEVRVDVLVWREPAIMLGLVGIEVVQNDMKLLPRILGDQAIHEVHPTPASIVTGLDQAGGHFQRGKQRGRAVALVFMIEAGERLAVGQLQPALGAFQRLEMGLFVHTQHHRVLRRVQVQPDDVGDLPRKARIGADAPAAPPFQRDSVPTHQI